MDLIVAFTIHLALILRFESQRFLGVFEQSRKNRRGGAILFCRLHYDEQIQILSVYFS